MKISRETNIFLNKILNDFLPPIVRDQRWFGWLITRILYKEQAPLYMNFHERVYHMRDEELADVYAQVQSSMIDRETNLNQACIDAILRSLKAGTVLEVGCGRGFLCGLISKTHKVTACDFVIADALPKHYPDVIFKSCNVEALPFADASFDTVVTTHMLEHVRNLPKALEELRRVTKQRLIVVIPCERAHFYTPSLHVHFFPYRYSLELAFQPQGSYYLEKLGGDWFYYEDKQEA